MPHSLRVKIKNLRYKGIITDKDCDRLCKALDNENVLDKIKTEIKQTAKDCAIYYDYGRMYGLCIAFDIIEKYMTEYENKENHSK